MKKERTNDIKTVEKTEQSSVVNSSSQVEELTARAEHLIKLMKNRADEMLAWQGALRQEQQKTEALGQSIEEQSKKLIEADSMRKMAKKREELLDKREKELSKREEELEKLYQARFTTLEEKHTAWEKERTAQKQEMEKRHTELLQREMKITEDEQMLADKLAQREAKSAQKVMETEKKRIEKFQEWTLAQEVSWDERLKDLLSDHEKQMSTLREEARKETSRVLTAERDTILKDIETELSKKKEELAATEAKKEEALTKVREERQNLEKEREEIKFTRMRLQQKEAAIDSEIKKAHSIEMEKLRQDIQTEQQSNVALLNALRERKEKIDAYERLEAEWGDAPTLEMQKKIAELKKENERLTKELANRPSVMDGERLAEMEEQNKNLTDHIKTLREEKLSLTMSQGNIDEIQLKLDQSESKVKNLEAFNEYLEHNNALLIKENKRLKSDDGRAQERDERVKSIEEGLDEVIAPELPQQEGLNELNEMKWLRKIGKECFKYGFKFPKRILYAFHTALKISDMSTVTVLAGVSGTGKSALPSLYARFGGLNFISVPVQPNWDSQESMLGFFNSIDNKFDAQPLLRFLAQCSSEKDNMNHSLNLVLLDEMNLAHVEYYFAEFLSKLEMRRDYVGDKVPCININIGAGMEPYKLALTRNILWAGTMNQDETTKSLSDKVLDRGIVVFFPRPKKLIGRAEKEGQDELLKNKDAKRLDYQIWRSWLREPKFFGDQAKKMASYKAFIEEINEHMAKAGRALGHRVWQSIEYYVANYPLVIEQQRVQNETEEGGLSTNLANAMHTAFEDQLVQKVMPKLRGIETTGTTKEDCLDPIQRLIEEQCSKLGNDFLQALNYGYGQFIWNSADYIDDTEIAGGEEDADEGDAV